jgi:hypothetical protein
MPAVEIYPIQSEAIAMISRFAFAILQVPFTRPGRIAFSLAAVTAACFSTARAEDLQFKKVVINAESTFSAAAVMDVDHDGKIDIVAGGFWYKSPNWERHVVREVEVIGGRPDGYAAQEYDVNGDGWMDFIEANWRSGSIKWIEHPGESLGVWTPHIIAEPGNMESGRLYDIDGNGQLDFLPNGANFAAWWQMVPKELEDGKKTTEFIRHDLPRQAAGHGMGFGDVNGDGRGDIVGAGGWLEAPEDRINGEWVWRAEFNLGRASVPFLVVDGDGDGDTDIIYTQGHGYGVFWQEQIKNEAGERAWQEHEIDMSWSQGHEFLWEDLDQNGRKEAITGKRYWAHEGRDPGATDPLVVYRYEFNPETKKWDRFTISSDDGVGIGLDFKAVDIDGDGDLDLVMPGRSGLHLLVNQLKSPEGEATPAAAPADAPAVAPADAPAVAPAAAPAEAPAEAPAATTAG